ncbi:MAG: ISKra4 family transposase [Thermosynechococcaceae cyanobacterium]
MTPEAQRDLELCVNRISEILHQDAQTQSLPMDTLAELESTVRQQLQTHVSPKMGPFFINSVSPPQIGAYRRPLKSILGTLRLTQEQAIALDVKASSRLSPYLEMCALRLSANVSYAHASEDIAVFTGIAVSAKTQQRLVHRQSFSPPPIEDTVRQMSIDGGNIRVLTPELKGKPCPWRGYKAARINGDGVGVAYYQDNEGLCLWVRTLLFATMLYCLGDGHAGIWKLYRQMLLPTPQQQILDWFHLIENLHKVGGSIKRLELAETLLWKGKVDETIDLFSSLSKHQAQCFCQYLRDHQHRIVNYDYYQAEGIPIGSGAVESLVKQIDRRTKISGAQWKEEHIPKVLAHRCAYLNRHLEPIFLSQK